MKLKLIAPLALGTLIFTTPVSAQRRAVPLENGMTSGQVITLWGPPVEKEEHEIKREDIWLYANSRVVFKEGKVISWRVGEGDHVGILVPQPIGKSVEPPSALPENDPAALEEILSEIMKEPGGNEPSAPSLPAPGANAIPMEVPPPAAG